MGGLSGSKKQTVGYRYFAGVHFILAHGVLDKLIRIRVDQKPIWYYTDQSDTASIDLPEIFGGESREGGVVGEIAIEKGEITQVPHPYLRNVIDGQLLGGPTIPNTVPAFRGVIGIILQQLYLGTNPYLKKWDFRAQRIHRTSDDELQWYDEKSAITVGNFEEGAVIISQEATWGGDLSGQGPFGSRLPPDPIFPGQGDASAGWLPPNTLWIANGSITTFTHTFTIAADQTGPFRLAAAIENGGRFLLDDAEIGAVNFFPPTINSNPYTTFNIIIQNLTVGTHVLTCEALDAHHPDEMLGVNEFAYFALEMTDSSTIPIEAMNPIHIIREALIDTNWGLGHDPSQIDAASFTAAADVLHDVEQIGLCILWNQQEAVKTFIDEIKRHINAELFIDRSTGLFTLKLIRDDYDINTLPILNTSNVVRVVNFKRPVASELVNSVTVTYYDMAMGADSTITVQDIAVINESGTTIASSVDYKGFPAAEMASRAAQRDLRTLSSPLITAKIEVQSSPVLSDLNIGSVFRFTWPDYGVNDVVMRITEIDFGDGRKNTLTIRAVQDVFAVATTALVATSVVDWVDPTAFPIQVTEQLAIELPYFELVQTSSTAATNNSLLDNPDVGYVAAAAQRPAGAINARLYTDSGAGLEQTGLVDFCPTAALVTAIDKELKTFTIANLNSVEDVPLGTWFQVDNELFSLETYDGDVTVTVKRGVLDTVPENHAAGAILFFWDEVSATDPTDYVASDLVFVRLATISGSGELSVNETTQSSVTLASRAIRPYPPGNVQANTEYFPAVLEDPLDFTWASRNRLQQTSGILLDWYAGNVTPEAGTTYTVAIYRDDGATSFLKETTGIVTESTTITALGETGFFFSRVSAQRDGYDSIQLSENRFWYSTLNDTTAPRDFTAQQENGDLLTIILAGPAEWEVGDLSVAVVLHRGSGVALGTPAGWTHAFTSSETGAFFSKISVYYKVVTGADNGATFTSTDGSIKDGYVFILQNATGIGSNVETINTSSNLGIMNIGDITWTPSTMYIYDFDVTSSATMEVEAIDNLAHPIEFQMGETEGTGALRMYAGYNHFASQSVIELSNSCEYVRITAIEILTT